MAKPEVERELIDRAIQGDATAIEQLLLAHFSRLERHIAANIPATLRRHLSADDVLQDSLTQAFRDFDKYDPAGGTLRAWLQAIADHRLADAVKRLRRKKRGGDMHRITPADAGKMSTVAELIELVALDEDYPSSAVAGDEAAQALKVALATLPTEQRDVIQSRFFDGMSVKRIARDTDRTEGAVRGLIHRAKKRIREVMGRSSRWMSCR
ncbi:MAG: RNA polymerase sigma factor [Pirellulales bacterium]